LGRGARGLGADKDEGALDRVFGKIVPPVLPKAPENDQSEAPVNEKLRKSPT
jgi:hypothetical protein